FFMDNEAITDTVTLASTGSFDTYKTVKGKTSKALTKGEHVFKVLLTSDYVNLDWIAFGESEGGALEKRNETTGVKPKFAANASGFFAKTTDEYRIFDLMGNMLGKIRLNGEASVATLKTKLKDAGYHKDAYVARNGAGKTLRIDFGR
ncbi:MAG: glycoside hydrolase, partial [Candidatus Saccharibacteria bacterium]|nr:glycoside hydrolase [Candidatus Saccharibacteria bacterium]